MKTTIGAFICLTVVLIVFSMARIASLSDRNLEEIQRKAAERKTGEQIGD